MASLKKFGLLLWEHKKKSIFAAVALGAAGQWVQKLESDRRIFRSYCQQALQYGEERILATILPRRVTVLAKDHKARISFEKYALPLLNLAGMQVDLVLPESVDQLKQVASVLNRNDADLVYVVGGEDTVSKVLAGLLSSKDAGNGEAAKNSRKNGGNVPPPLAIFSTSKSIGNQCENAMTAIRGAVKDVNVLAVKMKDSDPFCTLGAVHWGKFADTEMAIAKYWYWGSLKNRFTYFWKTITGPPLEPVEAVIQYIEPCPGCSKCYKQPPTRKAHWMWKFIFGRPKSASEAPDLSKIMNENCGAVVTKDISTVEMIMKNDPYSGFPSFDFLYGPAQMSGTAFLKEGWIRCRHGSSLTPSQQHIEEVKAREVEVNLKKKEEDLSPMIIGGEAIELADFTIKAIPKALQLVTPTLTSSLVS